MEISSEVISISKIRDGIFIGDMRAGINLDLLMQFKISHIINATGMQLPYTFESIGVKYLTIEWPENPQEEASIITNDIISKIIAFIDSSLIDGEGLLGFSFNGYNRICVVIILYIMTKFMWPLKKCFDYMKKKKSDMNINTYYKNQLTEYEKKLFGNDNNHIVQPKLFWNLDELKDKNELLMRNTYMNEVKNYKLSSEDNKNKDENKIKIIRHVEWGDNKKYAKQMAQPGLIHYNIDKDLYLKKDIEDISDHIYKKPLKSCIKNSANNNMNSNASSTIRKKKKNTKIYLAADGNKEKILKKNSINDANNANNSKGEEHHDEILTHRSKSNEANNNKEKQNIYENILNNGKKDNKNIKIEKNDEENNKNDTDANGENHIVNNLFITSSKMAETDSDDEIKLNNIIKICKKQKEKEKNDEKTNKNKKQLSYNIKNLDPQKITNNDIKPILNNLLKIDPNLQTLKKYLKANKKKAFSNFSNTFPNVKINITNLNNKTNTNENINTNNSNNSPTINTLSNSNENNNNINLIPVHMNNNENNQNKTMKIKNKEEKKNMGIYLLNLNLNIDNRATFNIKNNFINKGNNSNSNGYGKKLNNFFMDSNGNTYFNSFNKFKKRRSNTSEKKDNLNNHKYLSPNVNYFLGKPNQNTKNEDNRNENAFVPDVILNKNSYSVNNPRNNNQIDKTKIFMRPTINIDRNNINTMINNNKNILLNNITNMNSFNKKESKYIIISIYNIYFYSLFLHNKK